MSLPGLHKSALQSRSHPIPILPSQQNIEVCLPSKNELARSCKIVQKSCKNLACKTCTRGPFSCTILAQSCTYLARNGARFCNSCCKNNYLHFLHIFFQDLARIGARLCKKRDILRASLACKILARFLHDLASSFLLGAAQPILDNVLWCLGFAQSCYSSTATAPRRATRGLLRPKLQLWGTSGI